MAKKPRPPDESKKGAAFAIGPGAHIAIQNVKIGGFETGVRAEPGASVTTNQVTFDRVESPFDLEGVKHGSIKGTRIRNDPKGRGSGKIGGRKRNGPPLPAFCPQCKSIFPSRNYNLSGPNFHMWDNEETCPECGYEHAKLSEGVFNLEEETIRVLSAPDFTHAMLRQAKRVADDVISGRIDENDGTKAFVAISPKFRKLISKAGRFAYKAAMLIATLVAAYYNYMQYEHPKSDVRPQTVLESVLHQMKSTTITSSGVRNNPDPPASKTQTKGKSVKVGRERKPKARDVRRREKATHRQAMKSRRRSSPDC
jgi:hypothetical protein